MNDMPVFIPEKPLSTAVLFLIFNRLDTTKQVFDTIKQAKPPRLYIAADGARDSRTGEQEICRTVKDYVMSNIDWQCEVKTLFREKNLGCKQAVSSAIDWFFENESMGIILEDDCLPVQSFFWFCDELLERYCNDQRIGMISGTNLSRNNNEQFSYYYSRYPHIWGWASWRRVWKNYDVEMKLLTELMTDKNFKQSFNKIAEWNHWIKIFDLVRNGAIDTWDAQMMFLMLTSSQISIFPTENLISNIGFRSDATHTTHENSILASLSTENISFPLKHPQFLIPDYQADRERRMIENIGEASIMKYIRYIVNKLAK